MEVGTALDYSFSRLVSNTAECTFCPGYDIRNHGGDASENEELNKT